MADLSGKRALVTGGSRGIGAAIARALAGAGADVAITYEKSADAADAVVADVEGAGRRGLAIQADSADAAAAKQAVAAAVDAFGGLDILVNNAGIARQSAVEDANLDDIDALLNVNVRGVVLTTAAAIPHLGQGGRIITIGSNVGDRVPFPGLTLYAMTKSALKSFTRGLARDLGERGITVNVVQPGPIDTDMNPADGQFAPLVSPHLALGHYGHTDDIAAAVLYLASTSGKFVTGSALTVDGGFNA